MQLVNLLKFSVTALVFSAATLAQALETKPFDAATFAQVQQAGKSTALHFHANWCPTCKKQSASLEQLKADKNLDVTVFVADYDKEKALKKTYKVTNQSVIIVFKGTVEKARLAGQTEPSDIELALAKGL